MVVKMEKSKKVWLIIGIIVAAGIMGVILGRSSSVKPSSRARDRLREAFWHNHSDKHPPWLNNTTGEDLDRYPDRVLEMDFRGYLVVKSAITLVNVTISIILIGIYVKLYRKIKSDFTLGLLIVMFAFLVYGITSNPLFYTIFGYWGFGLGPFQMMPDIFATLALGVLLYLSLK